MSKVEYVNCPVCNEEITEDSDFCPHCGTLFSGAEGQKCDTHSDREANGICIICRMLVCDKCKKVVRGRTFCIDHKKVEVQQDWALTFQSTDINESELARAFLESAGHKVLVQNFAPVGFVWDGGGDSALSRSNISKPAKIFVPIPEYLKAKESLEEWKSGAVEGKDFETEL
jgi:RNA polymerase subunit RPABC4/transcription elongation factor Spt4